jgi:hypothetical protein
MEETMTNGQLDIGPPGVRESNKSPLYRFGPEDWQKYLHADFPDGLPTPFWTEDLLDRPSPEHEIQEVRQTHFAFYGIGAVNGETVNLLYWVKSLPGKVQFEQASLAEMNFAQRALSTGWSLSLIGALPGSEKKPFPTQVKSIPNGYQVTSAIEEVSKLALYLIKYGSLPEQESRIRCFDVSQSGYNVVVQVAEGKIVIDSLPSDQSQDDLGVGVSLKPQF